MDLRILVLVSALFIQGFNGAAIEAPTAPGNINGTPLESLSNLTPQDAKVLAELERLRTSGEQFQKEAMNFVQSLPNRLSDGFTQSHQLFKILAQMFSSAVNDQIGPLVENLDAGRKRITENAGRIASEGLRRGQETLNAGVAYGQNAINGIRRNGEALIQNGMSYVSGSGTPQIRTRSLTEDLPVKPPKPLTSAQPLERLANSEETSEEEEEEEDEEEQEEGLPKLQKLMTREDQSVTGVLSEGFTQVGTASTDALKNVAQFTSGGIRGLLDALSAVLATTGEVGSHARQAISGVHKSGVRTISTVIDTAGNIASSGLDKTGSIIGSMQVGGGAAAKDGPVKTR